MALLDQSEQYHWVLSGSFLAPSDGSGSTWHILQTQARVRPCLELFENFSLLYSISWRSARFNGELELTLDWTSKSLTEHLELSLELSFSALYSMLCRKCSMTLSLNSACDKAGKLPCLLSLFHLYILYAV